MDLWAEWRWKLEACLSQTGPKTEARTPGVLTEKIFPADGWDIRRKGFAE